MHMEADSLQKFNLSDYGHFWLSWYSKIVTFKVAKILLWIESSKSKIQNRLYLSCKKPDSLREDKWNTSSYSARSPSSPFIYYCLEQAKSPEDHLMHDSDYVIKIRETYWRTRAFYSDLERKRLLWAMLKMEMRAATISFSKSTAKLTNTRELQIKERLEHYTALFGIICIILKEYGKLKMDLKSYLCRGVENEEHPTKYFFNLEKRITTKKPLRNSDWKMTWSARSDSRSYWKFIIKNDILQ